MGFRIERVQAREVLDSRGNPTVEVQLSTKTAIASAIAPSGASTGRHEAVELRDGGRRFLGRGVQKAVANVRGVVARKLKGMDCRQQREIDNLLLELDGTPNKAKLGANATVAVSMASCKLAAASAQQPLYRRIAELAAAKPKLPVPFCNVINGGRHAGNALAMQEFMLVPKARTFAERLRMAAETYHVLKALVVKKYGKNASNVGDEGGFAPPLKSAEEALSLLQGAVEKAGYQNRVTFAIDAAASEFYRNKSYYLPKKYTTEALTAYYQQLLKKYPVTSLEDPFAEDDFAAFTGLTKSSGIQIVADDLTVSSPERIHKAAVLGAANCLLLKVNQVGTVSEAIDAARLAWRSGWNVMVSHRSGDSEDTFIADLAVGLGCGQIKAGAPARGERTAKYNRLLRIEEEL